METTRDPAATRGRSRRVLIACDKFKDSLTASQACSAVAGEIRRRFPDWSIDECPLADGGDGFGGIMTAAAGGVRTSLEVTGPDGGQVPAGFGLVAPDRVAPGALGRLALADLRGPIALVEMAEASGLARVSAVARNPWNMTSAGTGELIRAAVDAGAAAVVLGIGGSATHDLGTGALAALGLRFEAENGQPVAPPYPREWRRIARVVAGNRPLPRVPLRIACDVSNPLLGPRGAAAVFGPQKGLARSDGGRLEAESERMGRLLCAWAGRDFAAAAALPGAGAAGGIGFGLMIAADARLISGADLIFDWLNLGRRLHDADLVITGEGRFDESSLGGKGPGALALRALALGRPTFVFAGQVDLAAPPTGLALHAITPPEMPLPAALASAADNLRAAVAAARFE